MYRLRTRLERDDTILSGTYNECVLEVCLYNMILYSDFCILYLLYTLDHVTPFLVTRCSPGKISTTYAPPFRISRAREVLIGRFVRYRHV